MALLGLALLALLRIRTFVDPTFSGSARFRILPFRIRKNCLLIKLFLQ